MPSDISLRPVWWCEVYIFKKGTSGVDLKSVSAKAKNTKNKKTKFEWELLIFSLFTVCFC